VPFCVAMLNPDQVIHDRRLARVGRIRDETTGITYMRKVGKQVLSPERLAIVDFLSKLVADPHPNLLVPHSFSGGPGELLVEDYPDLTALSKLDVAGLDVRRELSERRLAAGEVVAFMVELSDAVAHIHRHGFVHRDVRSTNVFVRREERRLIPTLFDYDLITRPFFLEEAEIRVDLEAPPEVRVGHVLIDGRFDVYQLGWMLRKLTHYEAAPDIWTPVGPVSEALRAIIGCATGPFGERYPDAGELGDRLRAVRDAS
jgi:serine/threonine protein kinase